MEGGYSTYFNGDGDKDRCHHCNNNFSVRVTFLRSELIQVGAGEEKPLIETMVKARGGGRAMSPTGRTASIILGTIGSLNRSGLGGVCILYVVVVEVKVEPNNFLIIARHSLDTGTS